MRAARAPANFSLSTFVCLPTNCFALAWNLSHCLGDHFVRQIHVHISKHSVSRLNTLPKEPLLELYRTFAGRSVFRGPPVRRIGRGSNLYANWARAHLSIKPSPSPSHAWNSFLTRSSSQMEPASLSASAVCDIFTLPLVYPL